MITKIIWVALGGALGSVLRMVISMLLVHRLPWATLAVNFVGSLIIGLLFRNLEHGTHIYYFGVIGLCGGFTTFSTFSLDLFKLLREGEITWALCYMSLSVVICVVAVWLGSRIRLI